MNRFRIKRVRAIVVEGDDDWHHFTHTVGRSGVDLLTEFGNVHAVLTERRTKWWGWVRFASDDLDFNQGLDFLCHIMRVIHASARVESVKWERSILGRTSLASPDGSIRPE